MITITIETKTKRSNMDPNPQSTNIEPGLPHIKKKKAHDFTSQTSPPKKYIKINKNPEFCSKLRVQYSSHHKENRTPLTKIKDHMITAEETNQKHAFISPQNKKTKTFFIKTNVIFFL